MTRVCNSFRRASASPASSPRPRRLSEPYAETLCDACPMLVASLRMRLTAGLIDAAALIVGIGAAAGLGIGVAIAYAARRAHDDQRSATRKTRLRNSDHEPPVPSISATARRARGRFNRSRHRVPQFARSGLSGRRPSSRRCAYRWTRQHSQRAHRTLFDQAWQGATKPLFESRAQRRQDRLSELEPQIKALKRQHPGDPQARQQAVMDLYKANNVQPFTGFGWMLARPVGSQLAFALGSRDGRTVRDRITGTSRNRRSLNRLATKQRLLAAGRSRCSRARRSGTARTR